MNKPFPLTAADRDALKRLPEGWFYLPAVPYMVRCPRFRCDRLVDRAMLEVKFDDHFSGPRYRKVQK